MGKVQKMNVSYSKVKDVKEIIDIKNYLNESFSFVDDALKKGRPF